MERIKAMFISLSKVVFLILFSTFHMCLFTLLLYSEADNPLQKVAFRLDTSDGHISTVSFVRYGSAPKFTYFLITTYHSIYRKKKQDMEVEVRGRSCKISELIDANAPLLIAPDLDLAVFRCSDKGRQKLLDEFKGYPLNLIANKPRNVDARAVGNTIEEIGGEKTQVVNRPTWACISGYSEVHMKLPESLYKKGARLVEIMMLETINIKPGYSGGPVVTSKSLFWKPDYQFAGIIQGGIPGKTISWAIPVNSIKEKIETALTKKDFGSYPAREKDWPDPLFNYTNKYYDYDYSHSKAFHCEIDERHPLVCDRKKGTSFLELFANKANKIEVKIRVQGAGSKLTASIVTKEWFKVSKSAEIKDVKSDGEIFTFEWKINPYHGSFGDKKLEIKFYSTEKGQEYSIPLKVRVRPLSNNLSINLLSSTDFDTKRAASLSYFYRLNSKLAIGIEGGFQRLKFFQNYDVLPGFSQINIEIEDNSTYLNGLFHFIPYILRRIEPYLEIGFGLPVNLNISIGAGLLVSKLFEMGVEARITYYPHEFSEFTFNTYGEAVEEIKNENRILFSLGLKFGLNF